MQIAKQFEAACLAELHALKPGNVHRWADGHRMAMTDFEKSAAVAAPALTSIGAGVGRRVLDAVRATQASVGQNTNLGILLLCAPLALAAEQRGDEPLSAATQHALATLTEEDALQVYEAIRTAAPGGLGRSESEDVANAPRVGLLDAMALAADRDRIAWNYVNRFADIFDDGLRLLRRLEARGWNGGWPLTGVYLDLLGRVPDTHVARKHGLETARQVQLRAAGLRAEVLACANPAAFEASLLAFDQSLKTASINPGTTADLTVAIQFAAFLDG